MHDGIARGSIVRRAAWVLAGIAVLVSPVVADITASPVPSAQSPSGAPASATTFDVASIKLNTSDRLGRMNAVSMNFLRAVGSSPRNGRFTMQGGAAAPLSLLIQLAYDVNEFQILGVPSWANADRYDVDARAGGATTLAQMRPMLQSLLAERFTLTLHRETRPLPVYELMPAGNGLKIVPMKEGGCVPMEQAKPFEPLNICGGVRRQIAGVAPERRDVIEAVGVRMPKLLEFVSEEVGRVVLDKTGFAELFNFRLEFASNLASGLVVPDAAAASSTGLSIFTALDEQLGMRLRAATGPVEVLVIDRVERPSPN